MHLRLLTRVMAVTAVGMATALAMAAPAAAGGSKGDLPGANGTVKIDGPPADTHIHNEPHVTCEFRVKFFNFDANEHGNIVFAAQAPTGKNVQLLRRNNVLLSEDAASGGRPDPDEIYSFSAADLQLSGLEPHPKQGYHIKLTIERIGAPGAGKHKVFWLKPCETGSHPTTPPPLGSGSHSGGGGGSSGGGDVAGPSLPITGAPVAALAGLGMALIAGGAGLILLRRRVQS